MQLGFVEETKAFFCVVVIIRQCMGFYWAVYKLAAYFVERGIMMLCYFTCITFTFYEIFEC